MKGARIKALWSILRGVLAAAAVTDVYLWLLTGLARRRSAKAEA